MAQITPAVPSVSGVAPTAFNPTATTGDTIANPRGDLFIRVNNASVGSINATVKAIQTNRPADPTFPAQAVADQVVAVASNGTKIIGPIPPAYIDTGGNTTLICSAVTSVTCEAWRATVS